MCVNMASQSFSKIILDKSENVTYIDTMLNAITIARDGKKGYDELLDVLESLAADPTLEFASPTHAAVTLIRRSELYRTKLANMLASVND